MRLHARVTVLAVAATLAVVAVAGIALWQRNRQLTERSQQSLAQAQESGWNRLERASLAALRSGAQEQLAPQWWRDDWQSPARLALLATRLDRLAEAHPGWRIDVFDASRRRLYSSAIDLDPEPLLDGGWLARTLPGRAAATARGGLIQVNREHYYWVQAEPVGSGAAAGVLAVGVRVEQQLGELAELLGGQVYLVNLRGRVLAGTGKTEVFATTAVPAGNAVWTWKDVAGRAWLGIGQSLGGTDQRPVGSLVSVRDISAAAAADRQFLLGLGLLAGMVLCVVFVLLYGHLRAATEPLGLAVETLGGLARGDLEIGLDETDDQHDDEAGQIGRGVAALRRELLNLQMLRDERTRSRQQQERLIREQLRTLAESLEPASRSEILQALEGDATAGAEVPEGDPGDSAGVTGAAGAGGALGAGGTGGRRDHHLAELAGILSRLSGLITTQQARLLKLLDELRTALRDQALLVSLQQELDIARRMQLSILPRAAPPTRAARVVATMIPAREVGGDFYDYFMVGSDHLAVVVADVSGKGVPAAFFMAISRTLLKGSMQFIREPGAAIAQLNSQLCAENEQMMFVTMFFGLLDLRDGRLAYVNAGHNPPILLAGAEPARALAAARNMALAVVPDQPYREGELWLRPGDTLFLFTDGVTEAVDAREELFGEARLTAVLDAHRAAPARLPEVVIEAVRGFEAGCPQADDITCVVLNWHGAGGEAT